MVADDVTAIAAEVHEMSEHMDLVRYILVHALYHSIVILVVTTLT